MFLFSDLCGFGNKEENPKFDELADIDPIRDLAIAENSRHIRDRDESYGDIEIYTRVISSVPELLETSAHILQGFNTMQYGVSIEIGFLLRNVQDDTITSYYASTNTSVLGEIFMVTKRGEYRKFLQEVAETLNSEYFETQRSQQVVDRLTYFRLLVYLDATPLRGCKLDDIPEYIRKRCVH